MQSNADAGSPAGFPAARPRRLALVALLAAGEWWWRSSFVTRVALRGVVSLPPPTLDETRSARMVAPAGGRSTC